MENQKSALGLDGNITVLIGYLIPLISLILIFIEKDNKFVRFHAFQAVFWVVLCLVGIFAIAIVGFILGFVLSMVSSTLGTLVGLLFFLLYFALLIAYIGGLIYGAVKGFGGNTFKLPLVGSMAEKYSN
jgi:uncharacterized membrane protein